MRLHKHLQPNASIVSLIAAASCKMTTEDSETQSVLGA